MPLNSNEPTDIETYINDRRPFPVVSTTADLHTGPRFKFQTAYVRATNKPAWSDENGAWRYADGTAV
jgi:hypothetical protein